MELHLDEPGGLHVATGALTEGYGEQDRFCSVLMEADGGAMCFEDGERGSKPRNIGRLQKHLRQGASRRNAALDFSSMRLISGF